MRPETISKFPVFFNEVITISSNILTRIKRFNTFLKKYSAAIIIVIFEQKSQYFVVLTLIKFRNKKCVLHNS